MVAKIVVVTLVLFAAAIVFVTLGIRAKKLRRTLFGVSLLLTSATPGFFLIRDSNSGVNFAGTNLPQICSWAGIIGMLMAVAILTEYSMRNLVIKSATPPADDTASQHEQF